MQVISDLLKMNVTTEYVAHAKHYKYSVSDGRYKIYNHKLYKLLLTDPPESMRDDIFEIDGTKYLWMLFDKELELKEMREKVKKCVRETYLELEKILDEEKPSVYGRNKHTYEDVTTLIEYMRKFDFIVEE